MAVAAWGGEMAQENALQIEDLFFQIAVVLQIFINGVGLVALPESFQVHISRQGVAQGKDVGKGGVFLVFNVFGKLPNVLSEEFQHETGRMVGRSEERRVGKE